jgi:hypothetical protein
MADKMTKNYKVSGSGILYIEGDTITVAGEDKGEFNLANVLADLDNKPVKFSFSYDEDYEEPVVKVDPDTGEVIE